ncbi:hypothetical protein BDZ97DRAFT_1914357 [Flammula alnicola]|nr:hypothetical protein BDZ97DRAFT_1914357 [Flammula alnicola]
MTQRPSSHAPSLASLLPNAEPTYRCRRCCSDTCRRGGNLSRSDPAPRFATMTPSSSHLGTTAGYEDDNESDYNTSVWRMLGQVNLSHLFLTLPLIHLLILLLILSKHVGAPRLLGQLSPPRSHVRRRGIIAPRKRKHSMWIEGSILASLSPAPYQNIWSLKRSIMSRAPYSHCRDMAICQYFFRGQCRFGDSCRNEHPANAQQSGFGNTSWTREGGTGSGASADINLYVSDAEETASG